MKRRSAFANSPAGPLPSSSRRFAKGVSLAFLILLVAIGVAGKAYFTHQLAESRQQAEDQLWAVASLKVRQIVDWREERRSAAQTIMRDLFLAERVGKFLAGSKGGEMRSAMLARLKSIQEHNQALRTVLLDPQLNVRLTFPEDKTYFGPIAQTYAVAALRAGQVVFSDLHRSQFTGDIHLDLVVPLSLPRAPEPTAASAAQHVGVIVIEVDPSRFLYPRISDWPTSSRTAETVLVRREGNEVLYLNDLRHRSNTAMSFRLPVDSTRRLPATMAAMGQEGNEGVKQ